MKSSFIASRASKSKSVADTSMNLNGLERLFKDDLKKDEWLISIYDEDLNSINLYYRKDFNDLEVIIYDKNKRLLNIYIYKNRSNNMLDLLRDLKKHLEKTTSRQQ